MPFNYYEYGRLKQMIHAFSRKHGLNPQLVGGLIHIESKGNINAARFEPKMFEKIKALKLLNGYVPIACNDISERAFRATSWGLMQILGATARTEGYKGEFLPEICDPEVNLDMGCAILKRLLDKSDDSIVALFHYNAGEAAMYPGPKPNDYPGRVLAAIDSNQLGYLI